jgi:hypothetical protein
MEICLRTWEDDIRVRSREATSTDGLNSVLKITFLLLHSALWIHLIYYTPKNALLYFNSLKHLKCSYMIRSLDHPQGAYIVPC